MNQSINTDSKNSKEPQQKYRLGTVSIKILGGLKPVLQAPEVFFLCKLKGVFSHIFIITFLIKIHLSPRFFIGGGGGMKFFKVPETMS